MTPRGLSFGLLLAGQFERDEDPGIGLEQTLEQVRLAREAGFGSVWMSQHFLSSYQFLQPLPVLARISADSGTMRLGTCIALVALYEPVLLAEEVTALDLLTGGRFVLGAGVGYQRREYEALGVEFEARIGRFKECIHILRELFSGDRIDFEGDHFQLEDAQLTMPPPQGADLPIWIGATAPAAIERAAELGAEWIISPEQTMEDITHKLEIFRTARSDTDISAIEQPLIRESLAAPDGNVAWRHAAPALRAKYETYARTGHAVGGYDSMAEEVFIIGDPERCAQRLGQYVEASGTKHLILRMQWPGLDHAATLRSIATYGEEIIPVLERTID